MDYLEQRQLLSASGAVLSGGNLNITGTSGNDNIVVQLAPGNPSQLQVTLNNVSTNFIISQIKQINISDGNGNDSVAINGAVNIKASINAGNGNDTLRGSTYGYDTITAGNGNDLLLANGPHDSLKAGSGRDTLTGSSAGYDTLVAGSGNDVITSAGTKNVLNGGSGYDTLSGGSGDMISTGSGLDLVSRNNGASFSVNSPTKYNVTLPSGGTTPTVMMPQDIVDPSGESFGFVNNQIVPGYLDYVRQYYGFDIPGQSIEDSPNGLGQTIAIVDAYNNPTVFSDLTTFSENFDINIPIGTSTLANINGSLLTANGTGINGVPNSGDVGYTPQIDETLPVPGSTTTLASGAITYSFVNTGVSVVSYTTPGTFMFEQVYDTPNGQAPATNGGWGTEIDLDVEWAHAIAPYATIVLVEAASDSTTDLFNAVNLAAQIVAKPDPKTGLPTSGGVVSMSFGSDESVGSAQTEYAIDNAIFNNPSYSTVSFCASAGDTAGEDLYPAMSPYVTSVGGTTLFQSQDIVTNPTSAAYSEAFLEVPWNSGIAGGGGGGVSLNEPVPDYQANTVLNDYPQHMVNGTTEVTSPTPPDRTGLVSEVAGGRVGPDVAMIADPFYGVAVYDGTYSPEVPISGGAGSGLTGWERIGGTSLSSPIFAATVALANQSRGASPTNMNFIGNNLNNYIYDINNNDYAFANDIDQPPISYPIPNLMGLDLAQNGGQYFDPFQQSNYTNIATTLDGGYGAGFVTFKGTLSFGQNVSGTLVPANIPAVLTTGDFYNIGGVLNAQGALLPQGGTGAHTADPGFNEATGWGSPNVDILVTNFAEESAIYSQLINTLGFIPEGYDVNPWNDLNLVTIDPHDAPNTAQPTYSTGVNVTGINSIVTVYASHSSPPSASGLNNSSQAVSVYKGTGGTAISILSGLGATGTDETLIQLTLDNTLENPGGLSTVTGTYDFVLDLAIDSTTGKGSGAGFIGGQEFWFDVTVSNKGQAIKGDFYLIQGVNGQGKPIPWGNNGPGGAGGNIVGQFST
jgi:hypothetical protein